MKPNHQVEVFPDRLSAKAADIGPAANGRERGAFWRGEPNTFGTPEFMRFCRLTGAEPYFAANVRSLSPLAFDRWIEYCNAPADKSSLGRMRADDGFREPFNVKYWGIGNESWGCGGNLTPAEYSEEFRRFTTWTPGYGEPLKFIAVGPGSDDLDWTEQFCLSTFSGKRAIRPKSVYGWSIHHYTWDLARGKDSRLGCRQGRRPPVRRAGLVRSLPGRRQDRTDHAVELGCPRPVRSRPQHQARCRRVRHHGTSRAANSTPPTAWTANHHCATRC